MKGRIVIMPDGQVAFFVDEGDFEGGKAKLEKLVKTLRAGGVEFTEVGQVEQHRHDLENAHEHASS